MQCYHVILLGPSSPFAGPIYMSVNVGGAIAACTIPNFMVRQSILQAPCFSDVHSLPLSASAAGKIVPSYVVPIGGKLMNRVPVRAARLSLPLYRLSAHNLRLSCSHDCGRWTSVVWLRSDSGRPTWRRRYSIYTRITHSIYVTIVFWKKSPPHLAAFCFSTLTPCVFWINIHSAARDFVY